MVGAKPSEQMPGTLSVLSPQDAGDGMGPHLPLSARSLWGRGKGHTRTQKLPREAAGTRPWMWRI
jgi:hypothetical protein